MDIIKEVWRELYGEAVDSDWSVICVECGYKVWGDEPDIGIECMDCFEKRIKESVQCVQVILPGDIATYEVRVSGGRVIGHVNDEELGWSLAALWRLKAGAVDPNRRPLKPDLLTALMEAREVLETAKRYFPKSIKNQDRFRLLNVLANSVQPAIEEASKK